MAAPHGALPTINNRARTGKNSKFVKSNQLRYPLSGCESCLIGNKLGKLQPICHPAEPPDSRSLPNFLANLPRKF